MPGGEGPLHCRADGRLAKGDTQRCVTVACTLSSPTNSTLLAKFTVSVRGYTHEDDDMACVDLQVDFTSKPFFGFGW